MYSMSAEERHRKEVLSGKKVKDSKTGRAMPSKYKERGVVTKHMIGRIERYYQRRVGSSNQSQDVEED